MTAVGGFLIFLGFAGLVIWNYAAMLSFKDSGSVRVSVLLYILLSILLIWWGFTWAK